MHLYQNSNYHIEVVKFAQLTGIGKPYRIVNSLTNITEERHSVLTHAISCSDIYSDSLNKSYELCNGTFNSEVFDATHTRNS